MRFLAIIFGLVAGLAIPSAAAQQPVSSRYCVVPVQGGAPTQKEFNQAWRLAFPIITLPGVPRPVIYNYSRGGVWTIDDTRALVPFGGEFPSNPLHDKIANDPDTGRLVGINSALGVFALDPDENHFRKLHSTSPSLSHPHSIEFIPRFRGFVINDSEGLFLLRRDGALVPLPINSRAVIRSPFKSFDLPTFEALLINDMDSQIVVRFDDGDVVRIATMDHHDYLLGVTVEPDGTLLLRSMKGTQRVRLSRQPAQPITQGQTFLIDKTRWSSSRLQIDAPSIGRTIVINAAGDLSELTRYGKLPLNLPFDADREPVVSLLEVPQYKAVLIFTKASAYSIQSEGKATEIHGARGPAGSRLVTPLAIIPVRNEIIFLGQNTLNLLLDTTVSGAAACQAWSLSSPL